MDHVNPRLVATEIKGLLKKSASLLLLCFICRLSLLAGDGNERSGQDTQPAAGQGSLNPQAISSERASNESAAPLSALAAGDSAVAEPKTPANAPLAPARDPDAGWTPAAYLNARLPQWLRLSGEFRNREEGRTAYGFTPGDKDAYGLTRLRIGFDVLPNSWFHAFVQARDSEVIGANPKNVTSSMKDVFDLNQAYIELRNGEHAWISLKTGRQELYFGDERLVARSDWSNASREFDAVRLTLGTQHIGALLDVFAASVVINYPTSFGKIQPGHNFYGVNLALTKLVPRASLEPYVYLKTVPSVTGFDKRAGDERLYTTGLRCSGIILEGFDYRARYSIQVGHYADDSIHAWAGYGVLGYTVQKTRLAPRFSIEYNYASGNKAIGGSVIGTFDQLYPTIHQWRRLTDLFGEQNIKDLKPGFDFRPTRRMRAYFVMSDLSLASRYDSVYSNTGAVLVKVPEGGARSKDIGKEGDVYGTYDVNRRLQIGAGFGHLVVGQFLKQASPGGNSSYPYAFADYYF
jgi:hypothetical protein